MTQNVQLNWQSSSQTQGSYVAVQQVNAAIDVNWSLPLNSANTNKDGGAIVPRYLTIDNVINSANVTVSFGPFTFITPPFVRQTYTLPDFTNAITINIPTGTAFITLSEANVNPDTQNQLLIQQTSVQTLIYRYNSYNVNSAQSSNDSNTNSNFNPSVADMVFTLQSIGATPVGNGWTQWVKNTGTKLVAITPSGGDTINGFWNNANPMVLAPGDGGLLTSDGVSWFFSGKLSASLLQTLVTGAGTRTVTTNFGKRPDIISVELTCIIANGGYAVGDVINFSSGAASAAGNGGGIMVFASNTTASYIIQQTGVIVILNKTTGAILNLTPADWNISMTATAFYYGG